MKAKIIGVGIVAIIIVAALAVFFYWEDESPYYETETQFGGWGEEIIITYTDGTTDSLKLLEASAPLGELTYGGKGVNTICYRFKAKATGVGYTKANIKFTNLAVSMKVKKSGTPYWSGADSLGTSTHGIAVDDQWHSFTEQACENWWDIFKAGSFPSGTYTITFTPAGGAKYWGTPGQTESDATSVNLPAGKTITVVCNQDDKLTVVLGSGIET